MDEKATAVQSMFGKIAQRYDLANDLISMGQHRWWKQKTVALARPRAGMAALDLCTGTGDLALLLARAAGAEGTVVGVDFCAPMLEIARVRTAQQQGFAPIDLIQARAESLPLADSQFDCCTVAFGLRNVSNIPAALAEVHRVLKPCGCLVSLDCSTPDSHLFGSLFSFYFNQVVPWIGGAVSRSRSAYTYLPTSVASFPQKREMCQKMKEAGFNSACFYPISGGSVAIHVAEKG